MQLKDVGAERAVLAGLMKYGNELYVDLEGLISTSTFTSHSHQILYKCLERIVNVSQQVDIPTILSAAEQIGNHEEVKGDIEHIQALMDFPIKMGNALSFAARISKFEFARNAIVALEEAEKDVSCFNGDGTIDDIVASLEEPIAKLISEKITGSGTEQLADGLDEYYEFVVANKCDQVGISTGFPRFDAAIGGGLRRKSVDLIAARPKAQPYTAKILTPEGWKLMGDMAVGDIISHPDGGVSKVVNIIEQGDKECFRITLEGGATTEACGDHLWKMKIDGGKYFCIRSLRNVNVHFSRISIPTTTQLSPLPIKELVSVGEKKCRCITVDNEDGLYITDDYIVTHNCGKTLLADNFAINIAKQGIPVLMLDTEMSKEDHLNRIIASMSKVKINDFATGKFSETEEKVIDVKAAIAEIKSLPYTYASIAGAPFENILNTIKKWIIRTVGKDADGKTNRCVVVYDYLKLMSSTSISEHMKEHQVLGFQITALHNLAVKFDFPCIAFVQLNRDGITKESTDAVSGSDRLIWLCTSFSIFKKKSMEEIAEDGPNAGNRKLITIASRHGEGTEDGNYINLKVIGDIAKVEEVSTRDENVNDQLNGGAIEGANREIPEDDDLEEPPFDT